LPGKPENDQEFDSCREFTKSQGNVKEASEKNLVMKNVFC